MSHPSSVGGNVQKSPSSKAAALLTRGTYSQYVNTAKGRPACAKQLQQAWNAAGMSAVALVKADSLLGHPARAKKTLPLESRERLEM